MRDAAEFLQKSGWGGAAVTVLPGDASSRRYARLEMEGKRALLMDQPQSAETPAAPAGASEEARRALGYNAVARLAGADCRRFAAVAEYLRACGLAAPKIHAADFSQGLMILEDFGDALFADVVASGGAEEELYRAAADVLARLHARPAPATLIEGMALHEYDNIALIAETDLLLEWFVPLALGRAATPRETGEHRALWTAILDGIAGGTRVFVHRDYHAQNLIWMPERRGAARVGLIDFQDAVAGSDAYDLVSLVEDARRDVPPAVAEKTVAHYLAAMAAQATPVDENAFRHEMAVMAAQRNVKIVGIFARLYKRDGKARYLSYLPRVWRYLESDLSHPALAALRDWYDALIPRAVRTVPSLQKETA